MTYFNPKIYCKENLNMIDKDRLWHYDYAIGEVFNAIDNIADYDDHGDMLDMIRHDCSAVLKEELKDWMIGCRLEMICSMIDGNDAYCEDLQEVENYSLPDWAIENDEECEENDD